MAASRLPGGGRLAAALGTARSGLNVAGGVVQQNLDLGASVAAGVAAAFKAEAAKSTRELDKRVAHGESPSDQVKRLQTELAELRRQAAVAKEAAARGAAVARPDLPDASELKRQVSVGFSAAGLIAVAGGGGSPQERIARGIEALNKKQDAQLAVLQKIKDKQTVARAG
jgi:hypothetical protein